MHSVINVRKDQTYQMRMLDALGIDHYLTFCYQGNKDYQHKIDCVLHFLLDGRDSGQNYIVVKINRSYQEEVVANLDWNYKVDQKDSNCTQVELT